MAEERVIPPPLDDDDDDVAWALQTAAVQWDRGALGDAVVWLRRAVDAAIASGNAKRTKELNRLATEFSEVMVERASSRPEPAGRAPVASLSGEIPIDVDDGPASRQEADELLSLLPLSADAGQSGQSAHRAATANEPGAEEAEREPAHELRSLPSWKEDLEEKLEDAPSSAPPSVNELRSLPSWKDELDEAGQSDRRAATANEAGEAERPSAPPAFSDPFGFDDDEVTGEFTPSGRVGVPTAPTDPEDMARLLNSVPEPSAEAEPEPEPVSAVQALREEAATADEQPVVHDIALDQVRGFQDLPLEAQLLLARTAALHTLRADEELSDFAAALVTRGSVGIMPTISDISAKIARAGEVVFTEGSLADGLLLRVVALLDDTTVAVWDTESLEEAMADCPWVSEDLRSLADRLQALAGATLGPLGDRLDDSLRAAITDRLEVRVVESHEALVEAGRPVPGLFIVGAGRIEVLEGDDISDELGPGDILFASEVMTAGAAPATARAGKGGAVVLHAKRAVAHELMMVVPPLLEVLSGS